MLLWPITVNSTKMNICITGECGKGFMSPLGYRLHIKGHNKDERVPCEEDECKKAKKTFGSKSALKKHMKEQHPTEEQKKVNGKH